MRVVDNNGNNGQEFCEEPEEMKRRPVAVFGLGGHGGEVAFQVYNHVCKEGFGDYCQVRLIDTVPSTSKERQKIFTSIGGVNSSKLVAEDNDFEHLFRSDKLLTNASLGAGKKRRDGLAASIAAHKEIEDAMKSALRTLQTAKADKQTEHITGVFFTGSGGGTGSGSIHLATSMFKKIATEEFGVKSVWTIIFIIQPDAYITGGGDVEQSVYENAYSLLAEINEIQLKGFSMEVRSRNIDISSGPLLYDLVIPVGASNEHGARCSFEDLRDLVADYTYYAMVHPSGSLRFQENFMDARRNLESKFCQGKPRLNAGINCHVLKMNEGQKTDESGLASQIQQLQANLTRNSVDAVDYLRSIGLHPAQMKQSLQDILDQENLSTAGGNSQQIRNSQSMIETAVAGFVSKFQAVNVENLKDEIVKKVGRMSMASASVFLADLRSIFENSRMTPPNPNVPKNEISNLLALIEPEEKKMAANDKKKKAPIWDVQRWSKDQKINQQLSTWVAEAGNYLADYAKALSEKEMANFFNTLIQTAINAVRTMEGECEEAVQGAQQKLQSLNQTLEKAKTQNADADARAFGPNNPRVKEFLRLFQDDQEPQWARQRIYVDAGKLVNYHTILCPDKYRTELEAMIRPLKNGNLVIFRSAPNGTIVFIREEIGAPLHDLIISEKLQERFMESEIKREVWCNNQFADCPALCPAAEDKARQIFSVGYFMPIHLENLRSDKLIPANDPLARFTSTDARILLVDGIWKARGSRREVIELTTDKPEIEVAIRRFAENLTMVTSVEEVVTRQIADETIREHLITTVLEGQEWLERTFNELECFTSTVDLTSSDYLEKLEAEQILLEEKKALAEKYDVLIRELEGFCAKKFRKEFEQAKRKRERQKEKKDRAEKEKRLNIKR